MYPLEALGPYYDTIEAILITLMAIACYAITHGRDR